MKKKQIFLASLLVILFLSSCLKLDKDSPDPTSDLTMNTLSVSPSFDWKAHQDITISVGVETAQPISLLSRISVYIGDPSQGGTLITSGGASASKNFTAEVAVPSRIGKLFLKCEFPYGLTLIEEVQVSQHIQHNFPDIRAKDSAPLFKSVTEIGPDCDDCDEIISGSGSHTISNGLTYCVTENFSGNITFQGWNGGGTLKVCGTATLNSLSLPTNSHIVVTQNGSLTITGNYNSNGDNTITVYQNASLTFNSNFRTQGVSVIIHGALAVNGNLTAQNLTSGNFTVAGNTIVGGDLTVNGGIIFTNNGSITINGQWLKLNAQATLDNNGTIEMVRPAGAHLQVNSGSSLNNNGTIDVIGDISINAGSAIENNCALMCTGSFAANSGSFKNYSGYLKGAQEFNINSSNANIELHDVSMIFTENFTFNSGQVNGYGSLNSIYVPGTLGIYGSNLISGAIEAATDDLYLSQGGDATNYFVDGATWVGLDYATNYIPPSSCNPDGLIIDFLMMDSDGDGVPDHLDEYPEDPYRAFNNYFPGQQSQATIVFEDLWPGKGDFDFNDLVVGIYGNEVTNANNEVVEIFFNVDVKAVGASLQNGFGWQMGNLSSAAIQQATGMVHRQTGQSYVTLNSNGTEAGQTYAVIVAIENVEDVLNRAGGSMFNTVDNGMVGTSDLVEIHVLFGETTPVNRNMVGLDSYNFFIIKNQNRNIEIHLADRAPTDLMNHPWGENHDTSDPASGRYFKTENNLPWAILIIEPFDHPLENTPVIDAYPEFAPWSQSGGTTNPGWYNNPVMSKIWN